MMRARSERLRIEADVAFDALREDVSHIWMKFIDINHGAGTVTLRAADLNELISELRSAAGVSRNIRIV